MKAYRLQRVDREYDLHLQAWLNQAAKSTKEVGKDKIVPVYKTFKDFFDYEKKVEEIQGKKKVITPDMKRMAKAALMANTERG